MTDSSEWYSPEEVAHFERLKEKEAAELAELERAAVIVNPFDETPIGAQIRERHAAAFAEGATSEDLLADLAGDIIGAAKAGDVRVIVSHPES